MSAIVGYLLGLATPFVVLAVTYCVSGMLATGRQTSCRVCGYTTGPMETTRRIVRWLRWTRHVRVTVWRGWHIALERRLTATDRPAGDA